MLCVKKKKMLITKKKKSWHGGNKGLKKGRNFEKIQLGETSSN